MDYCEKGDLANYLTRIHANMSGIKSELVAEHKVWKMFIQIAQALQTIHKNNIVHGDMKPQNILLTGA
jgi:serine/threonine protein kinase